MSLEDRLYALLPIYHRFPEVLRLGVGRAYRGLPDRWKWGRAYVGFTELVRAGETWTAEEIRRYQTDELRRVVTHAYETCPHYRETFDRAGFDPRRLASPEDMERCPFVTKRDVVDHRDGFRSTAYPASAGIYNTTGGSSGTPLGFYIHKGVSRPKDQAFYESMYARGGYFKGARLAMIRGFVTSSRRNGPVVYRELTRDWLVLSSYHLTPERIPEYLEALERFRPDLIHSYPSSALQLAEYLQKHRQTWRVPLRGILCGSERLSLPQKRILETVFGCRVFHWYGHAEKILLAGQGRRSDHFYFYPGYGYVEFGPPDPEGLREVIGTSFHNRVMPLIRYRTGDYVKVVGEAPRGSDDPGLEYQWPAASEIAGREQEFLVSGSGRRISLTALNMHDDVFDQIYAVQFFQEEPGLAELRYVPAAGFHTSRLPLIATRLQRKLGDDFTLRFREVPEVEKTPTGKQRWLVSKL